MLRGIGFEPDEKEEAPQETERGKAHEGPSPADPANAEQRKRGCHRSAPARKRPHQRLRALALALRQPRAEHAREVGKAAGLASSKQEADSDERSDVPRSPGESSAHRPGENNLRQHTLDTEAMAQKSSGLPE